MEGGKRVAPKFSRRSAGRSTCYGPFAGRCQKQPPQHTVGGVLRPLQQKLELLQREYDGFPRAGAQNSKLECAGRVQERAVLHRALCKVLTSRLLIGVPLVRGTNPIRPDLLRRIARKCCTARVLPASEPRGFDLFL